MDQWYLIVANGMSPKNKGWKVELHVQPCLLGSPNMFTYHEVKNC